MVKRMGISGLVHFVFETAQPPHSSSTDSAVASAKEADITQADAASGKNLGEPDTRPTKKPELRTGLLGLNLEKYDATGLVPFYTDALQVPVHLQKYFSQRERYFSQYSRGCLLDEEGWYSVTPEAIADQIAERCRCDIILDAFCGVGGNAIAFARTCERVIALDVSPVRLALARHNAALYGVQDRIEFILGDFFSFAQTLKQHPRRKFDVVFLSPPWGGPSYLSNSPTKPPNTPSGSISPTLPPDTNDADADYHLDRIRPVDGVELFRIARGITKNVAYFLPRNTDLVEVSKLIVEDSVVPRAAPTSQPEMVEVEEEWMGSKLKALTCYFGGLVAGQEALFTQ